MADLLEQQVDHVVITGDYTAMALENEFAAAARAVEGLSTAGLPTTTLPGNHDVYVRSAVREQLFERFFAHWTHSDLSVGDRLQLQSQRLWADSRPRREILRTTMRPAADETPHKHDPHPRA